MPPQEAIPTLAKLAKDPNHDIRILAIAMLGQVGEPAIPTFQKMLMTPDPLDTVEIVKAVAPLGPLAKPLLPELRTILMRNKWWDDEERPCSEFSRNVDRKVQVRLTAVLGSLHDPKSPHFDAADDRSIVIVKASRDGFNGEGRGADVDRTGEGSPNVACLHSGDARRHRPCRDRIARRGGSPTKGARFCRTGGCGIEADGRAISSESF